MSQQENTCNLDALKDTYLAYDQAQADVSTQLHQIQQQIKSGRSTGDLAQDYMLMCGDAPWRSYTRKHRTEPLQSVYVCLRTFIAEIDECLQIGTPIVISFSSSPLKTLELYAGFASTAFVQILRGDLVLPVQQWWCVGHHDNQWARDMPADMQPEKPAPKETPDADLLNKVYWQMYYELTPAYVNKNLNLSPVASGQLSIGEEAIRVRLRQLQRRFPEAFQGFEQYVRDNWKDADHPLMFLSEL